MSRASWQIWLCVLSSLLQHIAPAIGSVPIASSQWTPTLLLHPLSMMWVVSCSHLIALRTNGCEALIFEASHGLGVTLTQSFVIVTCFNLGLPNHWQCLLVLAALYVTVYSVDCKQTFIRKVVCGSAQHAQTVWLHYCVLLMSPWKLQYHWNSK